MSRGKYSPWCYRNRQADTIYNFNCYGEVPVEWSKEPYDGKTMFADYDSEGFDSYGYSAFDVDGNYVSIGSGIDRYGYTENDYLSMDDAAFESISSSAEELTSFIRKRHDTNVSDEHEDVVQTANEVIEALSGLVRKQKN